MRLTREYIVYLLATLLPMLTACNEDDSSAPLLDTGEEPMEILLYAYSPRAEATVTRGDDTAITTFETDSKIGVFATIGDTLKNNLLYTYTNEEKISPASEKLCFPVKKEYNTAAISAYYPYQEIINHSASGSLYQKKTDGEIVMFVKSSQSSYTTSPYTEAVTDPLFACDTVIRPIYDEAVENSMATAVANLQFRHVMARLQVEIYYPNVTALSIVFKQSQHGEMNVKTGVITAASKVLDTTLNFDTTLNWEPKNENNDLTKADVTCIPGEDTIEKITITVKTTNAEGEETSTTKVAYKDSEDTAIDLKANTGTKIRITEKKESAPLSRSANDCLLLEVE